jgi:hypothetical protein
VFADLVEDAANVLIGMGYWEPDGDGYVPDDLVDALAALATSCTECCEDAGNLARHFLNDQRAEYERFIDPWTCDCGSVFKLDPGGTGGRDAFCVYQIAKDGTFGDWVGSFRTPKPKAENRDLACPQCGAGIADTRGRQASPQQTLF